MIYARTPMQLIGKKKIDILHKASRDIEIINEEILVLAGRMLGTLRKSNGVAIAAVQVGIPINLVVLKNGSAFVNIKVEGYGEPLEEGWEGCLSLPGRKFKVPRFPEVDFEGWTILGQEVSNHFKGFEARIWQHEWDHICGQLLSDKFKDSRGK